EGTGTMTAQYLLVAVAVAGAVAYLAREVWRSWKGSCGSGCGSGCSGKQPAASTGLVKPEELLLRIRQRRADGLGEVRQIVLKPLLADLLTFFRLTGSNDSLLFNTASFGLCTVPAPLSSVTQMFSGVFLFTRSSVSASRSGRY